MAAALSAEPKLHRARWVLPVVHPPIHDGAVAVRNGAIEQVGSFSDLRREYPSGAVEDHSEAVLLPGLVNAHTHLDNAAFGGRAPRGDGDFIAWIDTLLRVKDGTLPEERRKATSEACVSLPGLGTIAVADISPTAFSPPFLAKLPLWGHVFVEVTGFDRRRAETNLKEASGKLEDLENRFSGGRLRFALTPHALYSTHETLLLKLLSENSEAGRLSSLHLAESLDETRFLTGESDRFAQAVKHWGFWEAGWRPPRLRPARYIDSLGLLGPGLLAVHCVQFDDREIGLLAGSGAAVCLCPRSNDHIGVGRPRIADLLAAGMEPCLGTDGAGSVESLSVFDEMAFVRAHFQDVEPAALLRMATLNGARALRFDPTLGSLAPGRTGRFLAYTGDAGSNPEDALTSGIDHGLLRWVGDIYG